MPNQVVYSTNADYEDSWHSLYHSNIVGSIERTKRSFLIKFRLKDTKTLFILSSNGTLQVKWSDLKEKQNLLKTVKSLLVPKKGEELTITPVFQQVWVRYPPHPNFSVYWCNKKADYEKVSVDHLPKKMRELWNLDVEAYRILLGMEMQLDKTKGSIFGTPLVLCSE